MCDFRATQSLARALYDSTRLLRSSDLIDILFTSPVVPYYFDGRITPIGSTNLPEYTDRSILLRSIDEAIVSTAAILPSLLRMDQIPRDCITLRLPRGELVFYSAARPSVRLLIQQITILGYEVVDFPLQRPDLGQLPPGVWFFAVVVGGFVLFITDPTARSASDSASVRSGSPSLSEYEPDSDNVDPDYPEDGPCG